MTAFQFKLEDCSTTFDEKDVWADDCFRDRDDVSRHLHDGTFGDRPRGTHCKIILPRGLSPEHIPLILLGENAEVQISSNFVAHGFRIFDILCAHSGEKVRRTVSWTN